MADLLDADAGVRGGAPDGMPEPVPSVADPFRRIKPTFSFELPVPESWCTLIRVMSHVQERSAPGVVSPAGFGVQILYYHYNKL